MSVGNAMRRYIKESSKIVLTVGIVTSIDDEENKGRVKVRLLNRDTSDMETKFIRVLTPMAGEEWGMFFFPEVNDEVLVGFCDGDMNRACVIGSFWNSKNKIPQQIEDSKNDVRMIKTRGGHSIIFGDEEDKGYIQIITSEGLNIKIKDEGSTITMGDKDDKNVIKIDADNGEISITANDKITLATSKSTITIDDNVEIKNNGNITFDAQKVALSAKNEVSAETQGSVNFKATGQLNLEATGPASIKGAVVKLP